ncbi:MAG: DUF1684 domain-containing protein [Maribacter sp.]|nr:DUF1684 domain-containing protein [Maribacter sp.]
MRYLLIGCIFLCLSCKEEKKYHDVAQKKIVNTRSEAILEILEFQRAMNSEFKNPETSPLPDKYRKDFEILDFFPPDTNYIIHANLIRTPEALPFMMPTTTDRKSEEVVYGVASFYLNGMAHQLEVYQNKELMLQEKYKEYLFLPFTDQTNGKETYAGGRYLDLSIPKGDTIILNFNRAYNPYCAYNKKFSCPLVPSSNRLETKILAGVKAFNK